MLSNLEQLAHAGAAGSIRILTSSPSRRRHTAQEQPFEVLIQYPEHPRAGERVAVVRQLHYGGSVHFVIEQPDGMRALLPAWMTEPWASQVTITDTPRLTLEALYALRSAIDVRVRRPVHHGIEISMDGRGRCHDNTRWVHCKPGFLLPAAAG